MLLVFELMVRNEDLYRLWLKANFQSLVILLIFLIKALCEPESACCRAAVTLLTSAQEGAPTFD